jgi:ferredoxin
MWDGPPLLFVRPQVWHYSWFAFGNAQRFIDAGYHATVEAIDWLSQARDLGGGVWPRSRVQVTVDAEKCTGCTLCAALAPRFMRMSAGGTCAEPVSAEFTWSRADGAFVQQCPTNAITAIAVERGLVQRRSIEVEQVLD